MILPGESLTWPLEGLSWVISVPLTALHLDYPEQTAPTLRKRLRTWMTRNWMMPTEVQGG